MFWFSELPRFAYDWWYRCGFNYPVLLAFLCFAAFSYGACLGSFINVCIWRMPRRESVVNAPSHCTSCGTPIRWYDNLPVVSYLVLHGRCRTCHAAYSPRYFIVEMLTGMLFVAVTIKSGLAQQEPGVIYFYCVMVLLAIGAAWIDAEHRIIPDALNYPAMLLALCGAMLFPAVWGVSSRWSALLLCALSGMIPGAFLWIFAFLGGLCSGREVLGGGDVKFIAATGMLLGLPGAFFSMLSGSFFGMVFGIAFCCITRRDPRRCAVAFGPFLAAGALIWVFAGNFLVRWLGAIGNVGKF